MDDTRTCRHCDTTFTWKEASFSKDYGGFYCPNCRMPMLAPKYIKEGLIPDCEYCGSSLKGFSKIKKLLGLSKYIGCINKWCQNYYKRNSE